MKNLLVAVTGGIAAYKAVDVISALQKYNHFVSAMATPNALNFVAESVLKITANKYWSHNWACPTHIEATEDIDAFVVVPCTANTLSAFVQGRADNIVTESYLALQEKTLCIIAPAMNTRMWLSRPVQHNIAAFLQRPNHRLIRPVAGKLACGTTGVGKLAPTRELVGSILSLI